MADRSLWPQFPQSNSGRSFSSDSTSSGYLDVEEGQVHLYERLPSRYSRYSSSSSSSKRGGSRARRESRQRCMCFFMMLATSLSVLSLILAVVSLLFRGEVMKLLGVTEAKNQVCLPCNFIKTQPNPEQFQLLHQEWEEGTLNCCARSAEQYQMLFDLMLQRKLMKWEVKVKVDMEDNRTQSKGSEGIAKYAHARLVSPAKEADTKAPQIGIEEKDRVHTHSSGVNVLHDRLVISKGGLYFVYSQIFFENNDAAPAKNYAAQVLSHYVYRFNMDFPQPEMLLKGSRTQCWGKGKNPEKHASYVARVMVLSPNDQLYVRASPQRFISNDPNSSFFGVVRLGDALHKSLEKRST